MYSHTRQYNVPPECARQGTPCMDLNTFNANSIKVSEVRLGVVVGLSLPRLRCVARPAVCLSGPDVIYHMFTAAVQFALPRLRLTLLPFGVERDYRTIRSGMDVNLPCTALAPL